MVIYRVFQCSECSNKMYATRFYTNEDGKLTFDCYCSKCDKEARIIYTFDTLTLDAQSYETELLAAEARVKTPAKTLTQEEIDERGFRVAEEAATYLRKREDEK